MRIESIADHLDRIETIARWHWSEWGHVDPDGSLDSWTEGLRGRTLWDRVPTTYVALEDEELLGSVTLVDNDMSTRPDLWPWLAGLFVRPGDRRRGVGAALVGHALRASAAMGVKQLYLYTARAEAFYRRLGWEPVARDSYEDHTVEEQVRALFERVPADHGHVEILVNDVWGGDRLTEHGKRFWELTLPRGFKMLERGVLAGDPGTSWNQWVMRTQPPA